MNYRIWLLLALFCLSLPFSPLSFSPLGAQEKKAPEKKSPEKKSPEKKAPEKKADGKADGVKKKAEEKGKSGAAQSFEDVFTKFQTIEDQMSELARLYRTAPRAQRKQLVEDYQALVGESNSLLPALKKTALAEYTKAPNKDDRVSSTLVGLLANHVRRDEYDEALELGEVLEKNKCPRKAIHNYIGIAAFCVDEFDNAERHLKMADEGKVLEAPGTQYLAQIDKLKKNWEAEKKIREKEAKEDDLPRVRIVTSKGPVVIELFENQAPQAVGNFISLVEDKYYNGLNFHRVLPGFMAQGGCPKGDGTGGPGYNIYCECQDEKVYRRHFRGTLSMAHAGKDTGGSQFFMTFCPTPHLDGRHTAFGRVIEGLDVLAKLQRRDPSQAAQPDPDRIVKAEVIRKRDHKYEATKVGKKP